MKKSFKNAVIATIVVAILATACIKGIEQLVGPTIIWVGSVVIVSIAGTILVITQIIERIRR